MEDLLSIKNEKQFKTFCDDYLTVLGKGTSRKVYRLNSKQVIKVAIDDKGYVQNESECNVFNAYSESKLFTNIIRNAENYLWVIQPLAIPLNNENEYLFKEIFNVEFSEMVNMLKHLEQKIEYTTDNEFLTKFKDFLIEADWQFLSDFAKHDSWGIHNEIIQIIDYGMDNEAFQEYFKS